MSRSIAGDRQPIVRRPAQTADVTSNRIFLVVVGGGLLVILTIAGIYGALQKPVDLDPGTPGGVVQQYVTAVMGGDNDSAADLLASSTECDAGDLDRAYVDPASRIEMLESAIDGDRARVRIAVETPSGDLVQSMWTDERTIRLEQVNGRWQITGVPWPLYECGVWLK